MSSAPVAVFDLDGTITRTDSFRVFIKAAVLPRHPAALLALPLAVMRARKNVAARGAVKAAVMDLVHGGRPRVALEAMAARFTARLLDRLVKPGAAREIADHRARGTRLLLATASPDLWANPIGAALGFEAVLATRLAWTADGRFAGHFDGPNLLGEAKARAVRAWMEAHAGGAAPAHAYTDHHHDLPMLLLATAPLAVDPTPTLAGEAARRGIPVARWG
jgi:phosphatidylglycerophosphatase C